MMERSCRLRAEPQNGLVPGPPPPLTTDVLTSQSASPGATCPAGGPGEKLSTSSFSAQ
jgi:hypothetical protein